MPPNFKGSRNWKKRSKPFLNLQEQLRHWGPCKPVSKTPRSKRQLNLAGRFSKLHIHKNIVKLLSLLCCAWQSSTTGLHTSFDHWDTTHGRSFLPISIWSQPVENILPLESFPPTSTGKPEKGQQRQHRSRQRNCLASCCEAGVGLVRGY